MNRYRDKILLKKQSDLSLPLTVSKSYSVKKSVQGSSNKGYERFGTTAGMQCTCISIFLLCWSVIGKVSIWQSHDLDYIICTGYKIYKDLRCFKVFECWWFASKRLLVWPVLWCSFSWYWNQRVEYREKKFPIYTRISDFLWIEVYRIFNICHGSVYCSYTTWKRVLFVRFA